MVAVAVLLAGCSPRQQDVGPRDGTPVLTEEALITTDGARLRFRRWLPDEPPRAVILGVHGLNDYSNAFAIPAQSWVAAGLAVYAFDQRGFGETEGTGVWAGTDAMVDDLAEAAAAIATQHPETPLHVVGISMGGAVAMTALARDRLPGVAGTVLVAPAVWGRDTMPASHRVALWLGAHTLPWLKLSGRGLGVTASDNAAMLRALGADPLVIKETRIDALFGLVDLMDEALDAAPGIRTPLLALYGANDELIPKEPTSRMLCSLAGPHRVAIYEDGYHMLLRDLQAETVHRDVAAWIADTGASLPSGADGNEAAFHRCATETAS